MADDAKPESEYWSLIEPVWKLINIYRSTNEFLRQFRSVPPVVGHLFAAHWCQSKIRNGGLHQFFTNSTGVLAPEAFEGFRAIGLTEWAEILADAMGFFGDSYPRDRVERRKMLDEQSGHEREEWDPFGALDEQFFAWLRAEPDGWVRAADRYANVQRN